MDIISLLQNPEGKTLEFKRDLSSPLGVLRAIVAFANTAGGTIILGIEDKTERVLGIAEPLLVEEKLINLISDLILPQILPEIEVIPWRNKYLLVIQIFPSSAKPHFMKQQGMENGTYIRIGSSNRLADKVMQAELKRIRFEDSFDRQPVAELNSEEIDFRVTSELFASLKKLTKSDLVSMDLIVNYQHQKAPTVGGVILFGKNRLKYFPDAWIQVGRFSGITKTHIIDTQEIISYPIVAIEDVIAFVKKHAMHGIQIEGARHTESWSLPLTAIREAMINAVVHADYAQQGAPIRLAIFDDRIEIENPGVLLFGLTVDEIKLGVSKLRNRVIGQVFYRLGLIERWGSGIKRIVDSCVESGLPEPLFEEIGTHFRVTLFTQANNTQVIGKRKSDQTNYDIIATLKKSNGLSTSELAEAIKKSQRTTRTRLISLIEKGLVYAVGTGINDPGRKYFIKK